MFRSIPAFAASVLLGALPLLAAAQTVPDSAPVPFATVSKPLRLPDFLPALGPLHVEVLELRGMACGLSFPLDIGTTRFADPLARAPIGRDFGTLTQGQRLAGCA